jgi:ATPase family associated with various cellular activities (AAA)
MVMTDFRKFLRLEVVIPVIRNADNSITLEGMVIRTNDGRTNSLRLTFQQFKSCDTRFEVSKPLIFLYWKTNDIWSVIIPGKHTYLQLQTFYYDDKYQKRWGTGEVISQVYLENMQRPSIVQDFAALEGAYERLLAHGVTINSHRRLERQLALLDRKIGAWSKVSLREKQVSELLQRASMFEMRDPAAPYGLLLTGPPGTGKTQIARTLANESGLGFLAATTADVKANFLGQSGNRVKQLFERARANTPVILFLDELDIIAPAHTGAMMP